MAELYLILHVIKGYIYSYSPCSSNLVCNTSVRNTSKMQNESIVKLWEGKRHDRLFNDHHLEDYRLYKLVHDIYQHHNKEMDLSDA